MKIVEVSLVFDHDFKRPSFSLSAILGLESNSIEHILESDNTHVIRYIERLMN